MVLDSEVKTHRSLLTDLTTAIERALSLEAWVSGSHEQVLTTPFVRRRTQFDSVAEFCEHCPCEEDTIGSVQRLSADERDGFVARTTDFETWAAMKESAALADLVTLQNV